MSIISLSFQFLAFSISTNIFVFAVKIENGCSTCYLKDPNLPQYYQVKYSRLSIRCDEKSSQTKSVEFPSNGKLEKCGTKGKICSLPGKPCKDDNNCCGPSDIPKIYRSNGQALTLKSSRIVKSSNCYQNRCQVSPCIPGKKCKSQDCFVQSPETTKYKVYLIRTCKGCFEESKGNKSNPYDYTGTGLRFPGGVVLGKLGSKQNFACRYCAVLNGRCEKDEDCCLAPYTEYVHNTYGSYPYNRNQFRVAKIQCKENKCVAVNCINTKPRNPKDGNCDPDSSVKCCSPDKNVCHNEQVHHYRNVCVDKQAYSELIAVSKTCPNRTSLFNSISCLNYKGYKYCNCYPPKKCINGECKRCLERGEKCKKWEECCSVRTVGQQKVTSTGIDIGCLSGKCSWCVDSLQSGCNDYPCCEHDRKCHLDQCI